MLVHASAIESPTLSRKNTPDSGTKALDEGVGREKEDQTKTIFEKSARALARCIRMNRDLARFACAVNPWVMGNSTRFRRGHYSPKGE